MLTVKFRKLSENATIPRYMTEGASGVDLCACFQDTEEVMVLAPGRRMLIGCGIAVQLPPGFEAQVRPRSGLARNHGVTVLNAPGTIDNDYTGQIGAILINTDPLNNFLIRHGDRIAQLVIAPVTVVRFKEVEELDQTIRGEGGFGSTGK